MPASPRGRPCGAGSPLMWLGCHSDHRNQRESGSCSLFITLLRREREHPKEQNLHVKLFRGKMWLSKNRCYRLDLASQPASEEAAGPQPPLSVRTASPVRIQQEEVPKGGDSLEMWEISLSQQPPAPSEHGGTGQPIHSSPTCHHSSSKAFGAADHQRPPELLPPRGPQGSLA